MLIGYARVSSSDQNLDLQIDELTKAGCSKIFSDKISGVNKKCPGLDEAISHLVMASLAQMERALLIERKGRFGCGQETRPRWRPKAQYDVRQG